MCCVKIFISDLITIYTIFRMIGRRVWATIEREPKATGVVPYKLK
jgi:hypothetical protein